MDPSSPSPYSHSSMVPYTQSPASPHGSLSTQEGAMVVRSGSKRIKSSLQKAPSPFWFITGLIALHIFPRFTLKDFWAIGQVNKSLRGSQVKHFQFLGIISNKEPPYITPNLMDQEAGEKLIRSLARRPENNPDLLYSLYSLPTLSFSWEHIEEEVWEQVFIGAAGCYLDNANNVKKVYDAILPSQQNIGEALVVAAKAKPPKPETVKFLGTLKFDEGRLDEARHLKDDKELDLNTSWRSKAIYAAAKRGIVESVRILLTQKKLLDNDDYLLGAIHEAIFQDNMELFLFLCKNTFLIGDDFDEIEGSVKKYKREKMLTFMEQGLGSKNNFDETNEEEV